MIECYMTCAGRNDGIGAQIHGILSIILFCNDMGINYVHSPFTEIAHNEGSDSYWEKDWEDFFNAGKGEIQLEEISGLNLNIVQIEDRAKLPLTRQANTLFVVPHCHHYTDTVPDHYLKIKSGYLKKYNSVSKEKYRLYYYQDKINIAVHIRRGDVSLEKYTNRYTENEGIAQLLDEMREVLFEFGMELSINVFSQGVQDDFKELSGDNVTFYLNECLFTTFHNMVSADILITGKSSFSYVAALFSNGVKVYEPFWHTPQKDWIITNKLTNFDKKDFKNQVAEKLLKRRLIKT